MAAFDALTATEEVRVNGRLAVVVAPPGAVFVTFQDFFLVFRPLFQPFPFLRVLLRV